MGLTGMWIGSGRNPCMTLSTTVPTKEAFMAWMMSRPLPVLENMLLSVVVIRSRTNGEVGAGGVVVADGVAPIGVAVLITTRGAGRGLVAVS